MSRNFQWKSMWIFDLQLHFQSENILLKVHTEVGGHCLKALGGVTVETLGTYLNKKITKNICTI